MRELKALELAARARIVFEGGAWMVPSQRSPATKYRVALGESPSCTCEDFALRALPCKHVMAARIVAERSGGAQAPALDTEVVPVKLTYKQNWPLYNKAQTEEKHRFQALLFDLCRGIQNPPREPTRGRQPLPLADAVFAAAFKVYSTVSSRRFMSDLKDAHERGYLARPIHYNSINAYLENPELTPILTALIVRSAAPLKAVEVDFAVDSSGFSASRFVKWTDEKYGVQRSGHDWVKVHLMAGAKTNVVTAVEIHGRDAGDSPQFAPLVRATAETFSIREVSADKAYASVENFGAVDAAGGTLFAAFKSNATGAAGGLFEKMFYYFQFRRDEFLAHYHKRSNVESTFSMIKAKFRDHVRSRTDTAMKNEVLCKVLCHNLCCLISAQIELGIAPVFWGGQLADERPDVLKLPARA